MSKRILFNISIISVITLYSLFYFEEHGMNITYLFVYITWGLLTILMALYIILKGTSSYTANKYGIIMVISCISLVAGVSAGTKLINDYLDLKAYSILTNDNKVIGTVYFEDPSSKIKPYIIDIHELGNIRLLGYKVKLIDKDGILSNVNDGDRVIVECKWLASRKKSNNGQFNYLYYNKGNRILSAAVVKKVEPISRSFNIYVLRGFIINCLNEKIMMLTHTEPGLILGLFTGIKDGIDTDVLSLFINTSTVHLLTVSGFHFALIFMVSDKIFKLLKVPRNLRLLMGMLIMVGYFFMTPMKFSCLRALLMIIIYNVSKLTCKKFDFLSALSFVVLFTVFLNPYGICDPSFIMTYLACIGIGLIYEVIKEVLLINIQWVKPLKWIISSVLLTISIQLTTSLYQSATGGFVNVLSPLFNIVIGLMVSIIMYMSLFGFVVSFVLYGAPIKILGRIIEISQSLLLLTTEAFSGFSVGIINLACFRNAIIYGILSLISLVYMRVSFKRFRSINVFIIPLLVITFSLVISSIDKAELTLVFNDVGQGDSEMLMTENKRLVVIDTGDGKTDISSLVRYQGYTEIDYLVLSHGHDDHSGGTEDIISNLKVKNLIIPVHMKEQIIEIISNNNLKDINLIIAKSIMDIKCDNLVLTVIPTYFEDENLNNCSLVVTATVDDLKVLYTGDIEAEIEGLLLNEAYIMDADIIKVPHHGSSTSSTIGFIKSVNPKLGIIEVGDNSYGHPNKDVLEEYTNMGIRILRTDQEGQMILKYKNGKLSVRSFFNLK